MKDLELFELVNFHPHDSGWIQDMYRRELGNQYGGEPKSGWCQWAGDFLLSPSTDRHGVDVLLRLLALAEALYPGGMERVRLEESLGYLFRQIKGPHHMGLYPPVCMDVALQEKVIREDRVDMWAPGIPSGKGWRTYCRLTLLGKSAVDLSGMPPMDAEPELSKAEQSPKPVPAIVQTASQKSSTPTEIIPPWRRAAQIPPVSQQADQPSQGLPDDFIWQKPYVDQQVGLFFKHYSKTYTQMAMDVLNAKIDMNKFSSEFGPSKICRWINEKHHVRPDHPNPCKPQNINSSATYQACVKSFKHNPAKHAIGKWLYDAESPEVEEILRELLGDEDFEE